MKWFTIALTTVAVVLCTLLGWHNVYTYFQAIGAKLNPAGVHVYTGTAANPAVLPIVKIGNGETFLVEGHFIIKTPLRGRRCTGGTPSDFQILSAAPAGALYKTTRGRSTIQVHTNPHGVPCFS